MMQNKIKLGISLYSFSTEYIHEKLTLEQLLQKAHDMGYKGIEIVAAQMVPDYPYPTNEWLDEFRELLKKYDLEPVCWSAYIDMGIRSDRDLTEQEIIQYTTNDLYYAKRAGFPIVRTQHAISPAIYRKMIPLCRELGVQLTIEMHWPHHPDVPVWREFFDIMLNEGPDVLGVVPDFSIFQTHPHQLYLEQALRDGCRQDKLDEIVQMHVDKTPLEKIMTGDFNEAEKHCAEEMRGKFSAPCRMDAWKEMIEVTKYIHGKFYYLDNDTHDPCIPYEELLNTIRDLGYEGYIASEYEGHHFDETVDTEVLLTHFVKMCEKMLNA